MENVKMSDVFPEAFQVEHNKSFEVQDATWYSYGSKYESDGDQDSAIEHAVLNHDRLVEENSEFRETLRCLLKSAVYADVEGCWVIEQEESEEVERAKQLLNK